MIGHTTQPKRITVKEDIGFVKYYPFYKRTLEWYQDLNVYKMEKA